MKKLLVLFLITGMAAASVFAQQESGITLSGWGRAVFTPLQVTIPNSGDPAYTAGTGVTWGGGKAPRVGVSITGKHDKIGFQADMVADTAAIGVGDNAHIWAKPIPQLRFLVGRFAVDTLRGKIGASDISNFVLPMSGEDSIFTRLGNFTYGTVMVEAKPIDPLFIGVQVQGTNSSNQYADTKAEDFYQTLRVAVGYTIDGVGLVRAQYIGNKDGVTGATGAKAEKIDAFDVDAFWANPFAPAAWYTGAASVNYSGAEVTITNNRRIEAAFALTSVPNLTLDIGGKYYIPYSEEKAGVKITKSNPIHFAAGANYKMDALSILARVDVDAGGSEAIEIGSAKTEAKTDFALNFHVTPQYLLNAENLISVGADIGFDLGAAKTKSVTGLADVKTDPTMKIGIGGWVNQGLGKGNIKAGIGVNIPIQPEKQAVTIYVPVIMTYSF